MWCNVENWKKEMLYVVKNGNSKIGKQVEKTGKSIAFVRVGRKTKLQERKAFLPIQSNRGFYSDSLWISYETKVTDPPTQNFSTFLPCVCITVYASLDYPDPMYTTKRYVQKSITRDAETTGFSSSGSETRP